MTVPRIYPTPDTLPAGNSVTSPGAGSAFCSLLSLPPGTYSVAIKYLLTGTAETLPTNVKVKVDGSNYLSGLPSLTGAGVIPVEFERVTVTASIQLAVTAAAVAGAVYSGVITATRID